MELEDKIKIVYEYFYRRVSGQLNWDFEISKEEQVCFDRFVSQFKKAYSHSIGPNLLFDYFCFQFNYWYNKQTRFGQNIVNIEWVLGKKAITRWADRPQVYQFIYFNNFLNRVPIKLNDVVKLLEDKEKKDKEVFEYEENLRKKNANTRIGFLNCSRKALFVEESQICLKCKYVDNCKLISKKNGK